MEARELKTFSFELVCPDELLMSEPDATMVVLPAREGALGVLANHAPLISELGVGILEVFSEGKLKERMFVEGGFADIVGDRCTVLAEEATPLSSVDTTQLNETITRLEKTLETSEVESVIQEAQDRLIKLKAMRIAIERGSVAQQV